MTAPPEQETTADLAEQHRQLVLSKRAASQLQSLPSALPDAPAFEIQNPLGGLMPQFLTTAVDPPAKSGDPVDFAKVAAGFPSQALGPTFISYGPMLADRDLVFEEWESQIYGANGTVYNNQYCWLLRFEQGNVVEMREYNDSHHAALIFGTLGNWPKLNPPTRPRRRSRKGSPVPPIPDDQLETVFAINEEHVVDPRMLRDPTPGDHPAPLGNELEKEDLKKLVRLLRHARASGNQERVNAFYAQGFRHFIAGHPPFGWDHLPLGEIYAPLVEHIDGPLQMRFSEPLVEGNRVVEEVDSFARLDDGTVYNNWHCLVHEIRNGKIVQTREYMDTRHVWVVLGRWAKWGQQKVEAPSRPRRSNLQGIASTIQTPTFFLDLDRWTPFS